MDKMPFICEKVGNQGRVVMGATHDNCSKCGHQIWVSPSSRNYSKPKIFYCLECGIEIMKKNVLATKRKIELHILPDAIKELSAYELQQKINRN